LILFEGISLMGVLRTPEIATSSISICTVSTLYPNAVQISHGIFVETRLRNLIGDGRVRAQVVAPIAWLPPHVRYGALSALRAVAPRDSRHGIEILHPRYLVVPKIGMNIAPYTLYLAMRAGLKRLLADGAKFDVIDAHYFYPDGVAASWLAREFGLPIVITARGTDINLIPNYRFPRRLIVNAARRADGIITVCQALKDRLVELGVQSEDITVLRNGVDLNLFQPRDRIALRRKMGLNGFTLASVGHLIERKGHHHVITALTTLRDATLLIAGEGEERLRLESLAVRLGVQDRVRFLGTLDQSALCDLYNCADVTVLASSREGWANVLLESMACGTPVVASAVWGTPEVVASLDAGRLMPSLDADGVVAAVMELRRSPPDRGATRRYAEGFDWQTTTDGQVALFRKILAARASAQPKTSA
jgi:glycosyltransferase involved in cell wall biosynthesis